MWTQTTGFNAGRSRLNVASWQRTPSTVTLVSPGVSMHWSRVALQAKLTSIGVSGQGLRLTTHVAAGIHVPGSEGIE
jgi:hypothetical protein